MDIGSAKLIAAGISAIAAGGAAIGLGLIFGNYFAGAFRNPAVEAKLFTKLILGVALTEALGLFAIVISFYLVFAS
ncbi:MAG: ATP synthase F0 subunit C [Alphaproteobacteria bacterium]|nr:ATP synthase F0 subunit C [Alphaproteobacteria bacterium]